MPVEMTAYVIEEYGDPDVFTETTLEVPEPGPDEIRVEVEASVSTRSITRFDRVRCPTSPPNSRRRSTVTCRASSTRSARTSRRLQQATRCTACPAVRADRARSPTTSSATPAPSRTHRSRSRSRRPPPPRSSRSPRGNCSPTRRAWMAARTCSSTAAAAASGTSPSNWPMRSARP